MQNISPCPGQVGDTEHGASGRGLELPGGLLEELGLVIVVGDLPVVAGGDDVGGDVVVPEVLVPGPALPLSEAVVPRQSILGGLGTKKDSLFALLRS